MEAANWEKVRPRSRKLARGGKRQRQTRYGCNAVKEFSQIYPLMPGHPTGVTFEFEFQIDESCTSSIWRRLMNLFRPPPHNIELPQETVKFHFSASKLWFWLLFLLFLFFSCLSLSCKRSLDSFAFPSGYSNK